MRSKSKTALVAYIAAPHAGYLRLLRAYADCDVFLLGSSIIETVPELKRHIPAPTPEETQIMLSALEIGSPITVMELDGIDQLAGYQSLFMPDEHVMHEFAAKFLEGMDIAFDGQWRLRWDWSASTKKNAPPDTGQVTHDKLHQALMAEADECAQRSPDWWRQVGAVLAHEGKPLLIAWNTHLPDEQSAYLLGDPRSSFDAGVSIDSSLALHGEIVLITEALKKGLTMDKCDVYVTTFPCPPCAHALANTGIRRLFYREGYSLVAGAEVLTSRGIEIIRVV